VLTSGSTSIRKTPWVTTPALFSTIHFRGNRADRASAARAGRQARFVRRVAPGHPNRCRIRQTRTLPWAAVVMKQREEDHGKDIPSGHCLPLGVIMSTFVFPYQLVQAPKV